MPRSPVPPPPRSSGAPHKRRRSADGSGALESDAIDAALREIVPDARDRAFVLRCILDEGPQHHRVASWAILRMMAAVLAELGGADEGTRAGPAEPLGMRVPPSIAVSSDADFPCGVPMGLLREILGDADANTALGCLSDGPPHHALANAVMAWLLQAIHDRVRQRVGPGGSQLHGGAQT